MFPLEFAAQAVDDIALRLLNLETPPRDLAPGTIWCAG